MLSNKVITFSGFRDAALADKIIKAGGVVKTTIVKATNLVIYKQGGKQGSKVEEARDRNIEVMELEQFLQFLKITPNKSNSVQCNYIPLPQLSKDYIANDSKPPLTVKEVESLTKQTLKTGDIVDFGHEYYHSQIVGPDREWIQGIIYNDHDLLFIPIAATAHLTDAIRFYDKEIRENVVYVIQLSKTDVTIKKIFATPWKAFDLDKAKFDYLPGPKPQLYIYYETPNGTTTTGIISRPFNLKKLQKAFSFLDTTSTQAKISANVRIVLNGRDYTFPVVPSSTTLKKVFGPKATMESGTSSTRVNGNFDIEKVKEKISKLSL